MNLFLDIDSEEDEDEDEDDDKMTIKCHYNPIMDEFVSLTDEIHHLDGNLGSTEEMECLFDLCKVRGQQLSYHTFAMFSHIYLVRFSSLYHEC